jgi:DMSO reductase anchor subunit
MQPAFSVIFLTTLIGAAQGLFLALFAAEVSGFGRGDGEAAFLVTGGVVAVVLTGLGLFSSFFHLGRPERAWRAAAMWRTSWLSREVIVLPLFGALALAWTAAHGLGLTPTLTLTLGAAGVAAALALFVCTAMIYAAVRFIQEWASAYTLVNYGLLGGASGLTLATALAAWQAPALTRPFAIAAALLTLAGFVTRAASLVRNARLRPKSTLQTAIGVKHPRVVQRSMGFMGGSFNTREFFHGKAPHVLSNVKWVFLALAFAVPLVMLALGAGGTSAAWFGLTFAIQYVGLLAERWYFFAQANHPQNLYYQTVS